MTGSILTKNGRKNYYAVLNVYGEDSKRRRKWIDTGVPVAGNNKRLANKRLQEILSEYSNGYVDLTKDASFINFMEQWLEVHKLSIAPTTYDGYRIALNTHIVPYFDKKKLRLSDVTPAIIQGYVNFKLKTLSPNTVRKHLANISKCLNSAVKQNIIAINPVKRIELPKKIKYNGARHYNEKQIEQLLDCCKGDPLEIVIILTLFYGLRRSEVLGLKWGAVNFEDKTLAIKHTVVKMGNNTHIQDRTKNESSYAVFPMSKKIIAELNAWRERQLLWKSLQPNDYHDSDYICTREDGQLLSPDYVSQHFVVLLRHNNMPPIRFHDLRHSSASFLKFLGFDLKDIQTWLRHKDIQTTMNLYTHLDMEAKENIADKLDAKLQALTSV